MMNVEGFDAVFKALREIEVDLDRLRALSIHGAAALGDADKPSQLLVVLENSHPLRIQKRKRPQMDLIVLVGEQELLGDCSREELGGAAASAFLLPYTPLIAADFLDEMDAIYKKHVVLEALQNLILEHKLASTRLLIDPRYFLYDKLRRLFTMYPPIRPYIEASIKGGLKRFPKNTLRGFERALNVLVDEGVVIRKGESYSPSEKFVREVLSKKSIYTKFSGELEHVFRLYLSAGLSSPLESIKDLGLDLGMLRPVKIPEPSKMIMIETSLGPQPLLIDLDIRQFIEMIYGIRGGKVELKKAAGVLNSAYIARVSMEDGELKIFVKKYLNWTDFKWFVTWLWSVGVKNFSLLASIRLSNEIYFINKLLDLEFNVPEILHVNWPKKILFQKFIEGRNFMSILTSKLKVDELEEKSRNVGRLLGRLHRNGISMGDCNPFNIIFSNNGEIYLVDLEQCSYEESFSWDLAEMIFYTCHYLNVDLAEKFGCSLVEAYLEEGRVEDVVEAMDLKYSRIFAPLTPPWVQARIREAILREIRR
ncbi:MAG: hypothetical protein N3F65_02320 [Nitrososphaeria archaeon]|nr:hypothetical protein [Nitrososphaeria archaeon]